MLQRAVLGEDARLQERLHQCQDAFIPDASPHPVSRARARYRRSSALMSLSTIDSYRSPGGTPRHLVMGAAVRRNRSTGGSASSIGSSTSFRDSGPPVGDDVDPQRRSFAAGLRIIRRTGSGPNEPSSRATRRSPRKSRRPPDLAGTPDGDAVHPGRACAPCSRARSHATRRGTGRRTPVGRWRGAVRHSPLQRPGSEPRGTFAHVLSSDYSVDIAAGCVRGWPHGR